jgi:hypothetical protein
VAVEQGRVGVRAEQVHAADRAVLLPPGGDAGEPAAGGQRGGQDGVLGVRRAGRGHEFTSKAEASGRMI